MNSSQAIYKLNYDLLDASQSVIWNIYRQYNIDLRQKPLPGFSYEPSAFYMPQEVQDEFNKWVVDNWSTIRASYDGNKTVDDFKRGLSMLMLEYYPSTHEKHALETDTLVYNEDK